MDFKKLPLDIKKRVWKTIRFLDLGYLILRYYPKSILLGDGWFKSFRKGLPIDNQGDPIPWYPYAFIKFITPRINKNMRVFEYGCGNSTIWYSKRVKEICAVENDTQWVSQITPKLPNNSSIALKLNQEEYIGEIKNHDLFDIVVIDGLFRDQCYLPAVERLKDNGVIFWDNSDREDFKQSFPVLQKHGFKEISCYGMVPGDFVHSQSSLLYRSLNCMEI